MAMNESLPEIMKRVVRTHGDKLTQSQAFMDHRNLVRELHPNVHLAWRSCRQSELNFAFGGQP